MYVYSIHVQIFIITYYWKIYEQALIKAYSQHDLRSVDLSKVHLILQKWLNLPGFNKLLW